MSHKDPKEIGDVVSGCSMHPTSDSWYPSFGRGHKDRPDTFEQCECWECLAMSPEEYQQHALWEWQDGGEVCCFFTVYENPVYYSRTSNYCPECGEKYSASAGVKPTLFKCRNGHAWKEIACQARISFWGDDDDSLEKYFQYEEDARRFICHLPSYISRDFLYDHGFAMS